MKKLDYKRKRTDEKQENLVTIPENNLLLLGSMKKGIKKR